MPNETGEYTAKLLQATRDFLLTVSQIGGVLETYASEGIPLSNDEHMAQMLKDFKSESEMHAVIVGAIAMLIETDSAKSDNNDTDGVEESNDED